MRHLSQRQKKQRDHRHAVFLILALLRMNGRLAAQTKLFNKRFIGILIARLDIIKKATTLANHCQQTAARSKILFM
jgi:hypothetical protein